MKPILKRIFPFVIGGAVVVFAACQDTSQNPTDPGVVASCSDDGTLRLWDAENGDLFLTIDAAGDDGLSWVRFSPDGKTLASCGPGSQAVVWDLTYFDRHIAGNVAFQVERLKGELGSELDTKTIHAWAEETLSRPWPRLGR